MVAERTQVTLHMKEILVKKGEVTEVKIGVEEVEEELKAIKENE